MVRAIVQKNALVKVFWVKIMEIGKVEHSHIGIGEQGYYLEISARFVVVKNIYAFIILMEIEQIIQMMAVIGCWYVKVVIPKFITL